MPSHKSGGKELLHPKKPLCVAHRGACLEAPENTLASAEIAYRNGAEFVELDLHTSADGCLMVIHDATADRTTDLTGPVSELHSEQLRQCDASSWFDPAFPSQSVSCFNEFLELSARYNKQLYVELKVADVGLVMQEVISHNAMSRCFFWSPNPVYTDQIARYYPEARLMKRRIDYPTLSDLLSSGIPAIVEYGLESCDRAEFLRCRKEGIKIMICSFDHSPAIIESVIGYQPDMVNINDLLLFSECTDRLWRNNPGNNLCRICPSPLNM